MKLTRWIAGRYKPEIAGVYQRKFSDGVYFAYWTGNQWLLASVTERIATKRDMPSMSQHGRPWRGLASPPLTSDSRGAGE